MNENKIRHEIVSSNPDIEVRFYLSEDSGSYVVPYWHNSLELVYMMEGSMITQFENNVRQTLRPGEFSVVNPSGRFFILSGFRNRRCTFFPSMGRIGLSIAGAVRFDPMRRVQILPCSEQS